MSFYGRYPGMGGGGGGGGGGVTSLDTITGDITLVEGTGITITDNVGAKTITIASTSSGDVTLTAFGSSPNADGASLSSQALTLQPADASNPGGVIAGTQTLGGSKTLTSSSNTVPGLKVQNTAAQSLTGGGQLQLITDSGAAISAFNKSIGEVQFAGAGDGSHTIGVGASVVGTSSQAWTAGSATGGALRFNTVPTGTTTLTQALLLDQDQSATFSAGISATGANLSSLTINEAVVTDGSKNLVSLAYTPAATDSTIVSRDVVGNSAFTNVITSITATVSSGQTISMTYGSAGQQLITGTSTVQFNLPDATYMYSGQTYSFNNNSTGTVSIYLHDGTTLLGTVLGGGYAQAHNTNNSTTNGTWDLHTSLAHASASGTAGTSVPGTFAAGTTVTGTQLVSTISTGTAPLTVASTTQVANLNAATAGSSTTATGPAAGSAHGAVTLDSSAHFQSVAPGTAGNLFQSNGTDWISGAATTAMFTAPTVQTFTSTGSATGWLFTVTGWTGTLAVGDTYTNNGHTYTAQIAQTNGGSGQTLYMSGTGATSGSTLTKSTSASGPATITFSANVATGTYTTPTSPRTPLYLKIKLVGGGGGGAATGTSPGSTNNGSLTGFGLNQGNGGGSGSTSGGGTTITSPAYGISFSGAGAGNNSNVPDATGNTAGGPGGSSPFGGAGTVVAGQAGKNASANTGSGGGGGGSGSITNGQSASGGASGGYVEVIYPSPPATIPYLVGTKGAGATLGTGGTAGGDGADGIIFVEEHYQ